MLKIIDKIIVSDQAPKGKNVLWLQPSEKGYQIKVNSGGGYTTLNNGSTEEHEYVDLGLPSGTLWATCNIGATKPEEYGNYYAWGELFPKEEYTEKNSLTMGKEIPDITGNAQYDAARVHWGGNWRIPTQTECQELVDNCTYVWVENQGYKVIGPNGNSIFLPATGTYVKDTQSNQGFYGIFGAYQCSTPESELMTTIALMFDIQSFSVGFGDRRMYGQSIRPVKSK